MRHHWGNFRKQKIAPVVSHPKPYEKQSTESETPLGNEKGKLPQWCLAPSHSRNSQQRARHHRSIILRDGNFNISLVLALFQRGVVFMCFLQCFVAAALDLWTDLKNENVNISLVLIMFCRRYVFSKQSTQGGTPQNHNCEK